MTLETFGMTYEWFAEQALKLHRDKIPTRWFEELRGMAKGLTAAGVPTTTDDMIAWNDWMEITGYWWPQNAGKVMSRPLMKTHRKEHCSAIVATGSATVDGKPYLGHESFDEFWSGQYFNVCKRVEPDDGYAFIMQASAPCMLSSMTDFYVTAAGLNITETTPGRLRPLRRRGHARVGAHPRRRAVRGHHRRVRRAPEQRQQRRLRQRLAHCRPQHRRDRPLRAGPGIHEPRAHLRRRVLRLQRRVRPAHPQPGMQGQRLQRSAPADRRPSPALDGAHRSVLRQDRPGSREEDARRHLRRVPRLQLPVEPRHLLALRCGSSVLRRRSGRRVEHPVLSGWLLRRQGRRPRRREAPEDVGPLRPRRRRGVQCSRLHGPSTRCGSGWTATWKIVRLSLGRSSTKGNSNRRFSTVPRSFHRDHR